MQRDLSTQWIRFRLRAEQLFEVARDQTTTIPAMAGLRGLAVFLVFLTHYAAQIRPWLTPGRGLSVVADTFDALGHTGVDLFFVLSGYLIYGALLRTRQPLTTFFRRRARRIYPAFACVLALYIALAFAFPDEHKLPAERTAAAMYVLQNALLLPGMFDIEPIITVAWSLSYEAFYYLVAPAIVVGLALRNRSRAGRTVALVMLAVVGFIVTSWAFRGRVRLMMFPAGMLLVEARDGEWWASRRSFGLVALAIVGTLIPFVSAAHVSASWRCLLLFGCFSVLCHDAVHWQTLTGRLLSWAPLRWLGNMSYSYYLLHGLTLKASFFILNAVGSDLRPVEIWFWLLLPLMWIVTLVPTGCLFLLVEKPFSFGYSPSRSTPVVSHVTVGARPPLSWESTDKTTVA